MHVKRLRYIAETIKKDYPACTDELRRIANSLDAYDASEPEKAPESLELREGYDKNIRYICKGCGASLFTQSGKLVCLNTACANFSREVAR